MINAEQCIGLKLLQRDENINLFPYFTVNPHI